MIPVIIGAAVGLAGVAILSGDDKSNQQPETEKRQVSEDYVMRQLNRSGKNFRTPLQSSIAKKKSAASNSNDELEKSFANIERKISQPDANKKLIKKKLHAIENYFKEQRNAAALRRVGDCYEKIGEHKAAAWCYRKAEEYA